MAFERRVVPATIPSLSSLAGAAATLYLDFNGDYESSWGSYSNINTPAYDQDGDPSTFSNAEVASITQIWRYVAEDYAPFNVNVTTVEPPSFNNGEALRVVIGGNGSWTGGTYGGVSYVDSFTNSLSNVSFVFPANLGNGNPKYTGDASSHEAGHAFGLQHQSKYDSSGAKVQEYSTGTDGGLTAPLMGDSYYATRSLWWYGTSTSSTTYQDDMAVISRSANGFGYRPDDHGNTAGSASPLTVSGTAASGDGVVTQTSDVDVFSFSTGSGPVSFTVSTPTPVNDLAPRVELRDAGGTTVIASATATAGTNFSATVSADLAAGSYRLYVASDGGYGSVGTYTVSGTVVPADNLINPPTNLAASTVSTSRIDLSWTDNATRETNYRVERSADGGASWSVLADALPADSTSYSDTTDAAGTTYAYRVQAYNASTASDYSNVASGTTITVAPSGLTASATSSSRIALSWSDVQGESSYQIERSLDGITWTLAGTAGADATSFTDTGLTASTAYSYRVQAINAGGASAFSNTATATTPAAPQVPATPTGLTADATTTPGQVDLSWNDVDGETSYRIERSQNGGKGWSTIGTVGADVTTFTDANVRSGKTYLYRVYASNASGESPPSAWVTVTVTGGGTKGGGHGAHGGKGGSHAPIPEPEFDASPPITDATNPTPAHTPSDSPTNLPLLTYVWFDASLGSTTPTTLPPAASTTAHGSADAVDIAIEDGPGIGDSGSIRPWWATD